MNLWELECHHSDINICGCCLHVSVYTQGGRGPCCSVHQRFYCFGCAAASWTPLVYFHLSLTLTFFLFNLFSTFHTRAYAHGDMLLVWWFTLWGNCAIAGFWVMSSWVDTIPSLITAKWELDLQRQHKWSYYIPSSLSMTVQYVSS